MRRRPPVQVLSQGETLHAPECRYDVTVPEFAIYWRSLGRRRTTPVTFLCYILSIWMPNDKCLTFFTATPLTVCLFLSLSFHVVSLNQQELNFLRSVQEKRFFYFQNLYTKMWKRKKYFSTIVCLPLLSYNSYWKLCRSNLSPTNSCIEWPTATFSFKSQNICSSNARMDAGESCILFFPAATSYFMFCCDAKVANRNNCCKTYFQIVVDFSKTSTFYCVAHWYCHTCTVADSIQQSGAELSKHIGWFKLINCLEAWHNVWPSTG